MGKREWGWGWEESNSLIVNSSKPHVHGTWAVVLVVGDVTIQRTSPTATVLMTAVLMFSMALRPNFPT